MVYLLSCSEYWLIYILVHNITCSDQSSVKVLPLYVYNYLSFAFEKWILCLFDCIEYTDVIVMNVMTILWNSRHISENNICTFGRGGLKLLVTSQFLITSPHPSTPTTWQYILIRAGIFEEKNTCEFHRKRKWPKFEQSMAPDNWCMFCLIFSTFHI